LAGTENIANEQHESPLLTLPLFHQNNRFRKLEAFSFSFYHCLRFTPDTRGLLDFAAESDKLKSETPTSA
jgi:hypothetical protein